MPAEHSITKHGDSKERLYWIYRGMIQRCEDANIPGYKNYGGRGITISGNWRTDYQAFRNWAIDNGYDDSLTIERKDVNGPYSPENCCWIPPCDQSANRRCVARITAFGETLPLPSWAKDPRCQTEATTLYRRILAGWEPERAITTPDRATVRLRESDIPGIRMELEAGVTLKKIAAKRGVGVSTIMDIKRGDSWRHVP